MPIRTGSYIGFQPILMVMIRKSIGAIIRRNCLISLAAMIVVIALGIGSRRYGTDLPHFIAAYAGDTLWALLVFLLVGFLAPRWSTWRVAAASLLFSLAIELSQLYHAPWIDAIRHTIPGALVLGFTFLWSDLLCYAAGVAIGAAAELALLSGSHFHTRKGVGGYACLRQTEEPTNQRADEPINPTTQ